MALVHLTQNNFTQEVLKSQLPVLVDFWAEWCGPCRMIAPIVDEIAYEYTGKLKVAKLNVDEAQEVAMTYSVMSIPTLILFKQGKPVDQVVGVLSKEQLVSRINKNL
jgi:thioredoxin 1